LKTNYRDMAGTAFAMHRTSYAAVRKLRDNFGNYLWQPGFNGQPATLFGYPIAEFNDMPAIGANSLSIAFANWREAYQIVDRIGIRVLRDPYTAKPFVLFYTTKRTGGATLNFEAIKLLKFSAS
jgi:HK97 family phage major capsid protein